MNCFWQANYLLSLQIATNDKIPLSFLATQHLSLFRLTFLDFLLLSQSRRSNNAASQGRCDTNDDDNETPPMEQVSTNSFPRVPQMFRTVLS